MRLIVDEEPEEIKLNMTAMIDIVFQLLVFFILTFKVVVHEGDFKIKMPLAAPPSSDIIDPLSELIAVRLRASEEGNLAAIIVDDNQEFTDQNCFRDLTDLIEQRLAAEGDPELASEPEVEFEVDYGLKYSFTVKAIEAVSGRKIGDQTKKLVEKIKLKDVKQP